MEALKPEGLHEGDVIGIAAPAHPFYPAMEGFLQLGCEAIKDLGLEVKFAKNALLQRNHVAIPAQQRVDDLNELFSDPGVKSIFCLSGGANTNAVLPLLDWDLIARNPKIVMGFSANTALLLGLYSQFHMITFHGPHVVLDGFSEFPRPLEYTVTHLKRLLFSDSPVGAVEPPEEWTTDFPKLDQRRLMRSNVGWQWLRPGVAHGRLVGGNLAAMRTIVGTKFFPSVDSAILFLEEVYMGSPILKDIDDSLTHLKLLGVFDRISGLIVGKVNDQTDDEDAILTQLIEEHTRNYHFPILTGVDIGHTDPKLTLPIGALCTLDSDGNRFSIEEAAVQVTRKR